jgi:hypothetical protein
MGIAYLQPYGLGISLVNQIALHRKYSLYALALIVAKQNSRV